MDETEPGNIADDVGEILRNKTCFYDSVLNYLSHENHYRYSKLGFMYI